MSESEVADVPVEVPAPKGKGKGKGKGQRDPSQEPRRDAAEGAAAAALEERVAQLETLCAKLMSRLTKVDELEQGVEELTDTDSGLEARMVASLNQVIGDQRRRMAEMEARIEALLKENQVLREQLAWEPALDGLRQELERRVEQCEAITAQGGRLVQPAGRMEAPKPKAYDGSRSARDIDNFIYHMERYFDATFMLDDGSKLRTIPLFLGDVATLWWRRICEDVARGRRAAVSTWQEFKAELKRQFYPEHATDDARRKLRRLKQTGTVRDYVKAFTELMLEIPDMTEQDALFAFEDGLASWAQMEVKRRNVRTLNDAIREAESLIEFKAPKQGKDEAKVKDGGDPMGGEAKSTKTKEPRGSSKAFEGQRKPLECFLCSGPHMARDCPQRQRLAAMVRQGDSSAQDTADEGAV
jgi:hypothetical protein